MIELFIPVLFICINDMDNCNFMQGQNSYKSEALCRISIETQKKYMKEIANEADRQKITIIEGTCINIKIDKPGKMI